MSDIMWSPWREKFVVNQHSSSEECIFDVLPKENKDSQNFILTRTVHAYAMLNIYPYNIGHTMIIPFRHTNNYLSITKDENQDIQLLTNKMIKILERIYKPSGFNIGINIGRIAGAGIPDHLHWHIVPRWEGDTGFMGTTSNTRVMPESLENTYKKITEALLNDR